MKVSVSSYSFNRLLQKGEMTQFDCIAKAKELGFDAIEFSGIIAPSGVSELEYAKKLREEAMKVNIPISALMVSADFLNNDIDEEIRRIKDLILVAKELGVNLVRHDATKYSKHAFDSVLPLLSDACRQVTEYAQEFGIKTMVENHGFYCQDSERLEKLYSAVNHTNFGILADIGNFLCVDEDPAKAISRLAPYVIHAHAKDFHVKPAMETDPGEGFFTSRSGNYLRGAIIGHGNVPVLHCLKALKRAGYNGYIAIEFEGLEDNIYGLSVGLKNLRKYIGIIGNNGG